VQICSLSVTDTAHALKPQSAQEEKNNAHKVSTQKTDKSPNGEELTPEQQRELDELKKRDLQVKRHEQAHQAAGAGLTGGATYTYRTGPDGKRYAVGGEVSIDVSKEKEPEDTITKMQRVKRAALAPADPSAQDRAVARKADANIREAQGEIREEQNESDSSETVSVDVLA